MAQHSRRMMDGLTNAIKLVFDVAAGRDYRALNSYILQINQQNSVHEILMSVSTCLKDILDYELFGFALQDGTMLDVWVDPCIHKDFIVQAVKNDFDGQKNDLTFHDFGKSAETKGQIADVISAEKIASFQVLDGASAARLYVLPRRKVFSYHQDILRIIVRSLSIALANALRVQHLENAAAIDPLTNCYNRRALDKHLESAVANGLRYERSLSIVMIDLDNFKKINDTYGHQVGDAVLKAASALITANVRKSDVLARYGGEEFVLVLPETGLYHATQLAEKLRKKLACHVLSTEGTNISVTASFGVASLRKKLNSADLLHEADEMLYLAKYQGKNIVAPLLAPDPAGPLPLVSEQALQFA